jgi:hypothetical protein
LGIGPIWISRCCSCDKEREMEVITQTTLILMLIAYIAGLITAMMLLTSRS